MKKDQQGEPEKVEIVSPLTGRKLQIPKGRYNQAGRRLRKMLREAGLKPPSPPRP